jgi:hypothetical protein
MKRLLVAIVLIGICACPAMAQYFVVPQGALAPDGGLNYTFPTGYPFHAYPPHYPGTPLYWTSYPMVPVPGLQEMGPSGAWGMSGHQPMR